MSLLDDTPHDLFDEEKPASRGQLKLIAIEACKLLGLPAPTSRFDASHALVRLRLALAEHGPGEPAPDLRFDGPARPPDVGS